MKEVVWFASELRPRGKIGKLPPERQLESLNKWLADERPWIQYLCKEHFDGTLGTVQMVVYGFGEPFASFTINPSGTVTDYRKTTSSELLRQPNEEKTSAIYSRGELDSCTDFQELETRPRILEPNRTVGVGQESVYVYTTTADHKIGRVKIGKAINDPKSRIFSQFGTSNSSGPIWLLQIRTEDSAELERWLHNDLKQKERHIKDGGGAEWFDTTAEEVEQIYCTIVSSIS